MKGGERVRGLVEIRVDVRDGLEEGYWSFRAYLWRRKGERRTLKGGERGR